MEFDMIAGAGANLHQQFGLPFWRGALVCSILVVVVSFLDFEKLSEMSVADTESIQEDIMEYAHDIINSPVDENEFVKKELEIEQPIDLNKKS